MKKKIFAVLALALSFSLVAEGVGLAINIDPLGYMNHTIITTYDSEKLADNLKDEFVNAGLIGELQIGDQNSKNVYNAYALGLDVTYKVFYTSLSLGLPAKMYSSGFDPISIMYPGTFKDSNKIGGTIILDGQLGGGVDLMKILKKENNLSFFVGGGIAVNYVHVKRPVEKDTLLGQKLASAKTITEFQNIVQAGLGLRAGVSYYFNPNVGINLNFTDSLHFIKLYSQRMFAGETVAGLQYKYFLTKDGNENKMIKRQFANNFTLRLGLGIKF